MEELSYEDVFPAGQFREEAIIQMGKYACCYVSEAAWKLCFAPLVFVDYSYFKFTEIAMNECTWTPPPRYIRLAKGSLDFSMGIVILVLDYYKGNFYFIIII